MRTRNCLLALVALGLTTFYPMQDTVSAQSGSGIVISEFRFRGPLGVNDEFIELFNAGTVPVNVGGWLIRSSNNVQPPGFFTRATIPANTIINPGCYYLVANAASGGFSGGVTPNLTYSVGFADDGGAALTTSSPSVIVDQVGQGTVPAAYGEGQRLPMVNTNVNRGLERRPGGALGHLDTNNNSADFGEIIPANPQNSNTCIVTQVYLPHEIQGPGTVSPIATGTSVTVRGVVIARKANGFFIQTEPGQEDADDASSEGLFVSAGGSSLASALVGHAVRVSGVVAESAPAPGSATVTQIASVVNVTDLGAATLPTPVTLTGVELSDSGTLDQLERFEGMRVTAPSLTAVSGSEGGAFYAVLTGRARTFREPGVAAGEVVPACAIGPCNIPMFDGNPERIRVDTDGLEGVAGVSLSSGAVVTNVTGPLDYEHHIYTVLAESTPSVSGGTVATVAATALGNEFTVASFTLGAAFPAQMSKASLLVRNTLGMPDILAVQDAPDLATLQAFAAAVDADAAAVGQVVPAYAVESGFLLKQAGGRVALLSAEHIGGDPSAPVVLRAIVSAPAQMPQPVTVISNQFAPFSTAAASLAARQAQAELLASYIQARQSNDPSEAIVSVGNYNAHRFNDGYADIMGTVLGTPAPPDQVAVEAHDLLSRDLVSAGDSLDPLQRYSSIVDGHAQLFDHVVMSANLAAQFSGMAYPRVNADFADVHREDASVPTRLSDRDPVVAYFTFPPDLTAPVFDSAPADLVIEATSAAGALGNYVTPTATDNLDAAVNVHCLPGSGGQFPLGSTNVTCSADDVAGNHLEASFTLTVVDTTAPQITVPDTIVVEATSAAGATVHFTVNATDLVTAEPLFGCSRPSGSTFKVGTTSNTCYAFDEAGNAVTTTFLVVVTQPVPGRMNGSGAIMNGAVRTSFSFAVRQTASYSDRGTVTLLIRGGGKPDRSFTAAVDDVRLGVESGAFSGIGELNGVAGYRVEVSALDRGEPGVGVDRFTLRLLAPDGTLAESGSGALRSGNIQLLR